MCFDLFRINILAIAEDDDFFHSPGNKQIFPRVEISDVASVQPAIFQHGGSRVRPVPITFHYDGTANRNLADRLDIFSGWLRIDNPSLRTRQRSTYGPNHVVVGCSKERSTGGLSEAVSLKDVDA